MMMTVARTSSATFPEAYFTESDTMMRSPSQRVLSMAGLFTFGMLMATTTGAAAVPPEQVIIGHELRTGAFGAAADNIASATVDPPSASDALQSLRADSGLTWDQLSKLFGVSRRALHHWAAGGQMSAHNIETLSRLTTEIKRLPGATPTAKREALMLSAADGISAYDRLRRASISSEVDINELPISLVALLGGEEI